MLTYNRNLRVYALKEHEFWCFFHDKIFFFVPAYFLLMISSEKSLPIVKIISPSVSIFSAAKDFQLGRFQFCLKVEIKVWRSESIGIRVHPRLE